MTVAAAALGTVGTRPRSAWFRGLRKPPWNPPDAAFPLVWTPVYALIADGTGRMVAAADEADRRRLLALTAADLAVNAGWCWAFFTGESTRAGLAAILGLDLLNLALLREAAKRDRVAAAELAPYVVWTGFATASTPRSGAGTADPGRIGWAAPVRVAVGLPRHRRAEQWPAHRCPGRAPGRPSGVRSVRVSGGGGDPGRRAG